MPARRDRELEALQEQMGPSYTVTREWAYAVRNRWNEWVIIESDEKEAKRRKRGAEAYRRNFGGPAPEHKVTSRLAVRSAWS